MRREVELLRDLLHLVLVVAQVQTQTLRLVGGRLGTLDGRLSRGSSTLFMSDRLAPSTASPTGMPSASVSRLRLLRFLAWSVGFFACLFSPKGCLGHAPVHIQAGPIDPFPIVVGQEAEFP